MAKKTIKAQMKQRRDTKANWEATNPVLLDGELGIVSDDPNLYKVGDGATAWNSLPFRGFDGTVTQELGNSAAAVMSQKAVSDKFAEVDLNLTSIKSKPKIYQFSTRDGRVLRGDVLGAGKVEGFSTSDYIPTGKASKIIYRNTFEVQPNNYYAGFVLYNANNIIYVGGGSGEVNLADYPDAVSFRYCIPAGTALEDCMVEVREEVETHTLLELTEDVEFLKNSLFETRRYQFTEVNGRVLRGDVVGMAAVEGYSTSDFIEIGNAYKIVYNNTYEVQAANYFAGFVMYNAAKDTIIYVGGGSGEVNLEAYPDAKYFRFCYDPAKELGACNVEVTRIEGGDNLTSVSEIDFINTSGEQTEQIPGDAVLVGYDKVFEKNGILAEYRIAISDASADDLGSEFEFYLGHIDQRNWLLPRLTFRKTVDRVDGNSLIFDFSSDLISFKKNEVLFIKAKNVALHKGSTALLYTNSLINAVQPYGTGFEASIRLTIKNVDSYFAAKEDLDAIEENVNKVDSSLNRKQDSVLIDEANGNKYKITVSNGALALKLLKYSKVLFIGNSFTAHERVAGLWECDGRSMAASTDSTMYAAFVAEQMNLEADRAGLVGFERNLSGFDFSNLPNKSTDYDAVVVQLGENIIETDTAIIKQAFRNLFTAIKSNWPGGDVFAMLGTSLTATSAIADVAAEMGIPVINCGAVSLATPYQHKDYYIGSDGRYYELNDAVYRSHPSDMGMYNMALKIIEAFGGTAANKMFGLTLNQSNGGLISTASNKWVTGGVVTVRCVADAGKTINDLTVTSDGQNIAAVKRIGTYTAYTFIMPNGAVEISATWK